MRMHRGRVRKHNSTITGISSSRVLGFLNPNSKETQKKKEQRMIEMQKVKPPHAVIKHHN